MQVLMTGNLRKLKSEVQEFVQYSLPIGEIDLPLNNFLGKTIQLKFLQINCIHCNKVIKKSYHQGYCFPCAQTLARCDFCILKPETCHYHLGTCREPEWGLQHCFIPHIVYLANTSGLKVGIARETQIPTRWIDQGAVQAIPLFRVQNRYHSGLLEVALKRSVQDKTDWRKMLSSEGECVDLIHQRDQLLDELRDALQIEDPKEKSRLPEVLLATKVKQLQFPVLQYPNKVKSLNVEKTPEIQGTLLGIKGQYFIMDIGVLNIRNVGGYQVEFSG